MTEQRRTALKKLQRLDRQIESARREIGDFDPLFAEVEDPALVLESELGTTRSRLQEMKLAERRLELATEEKGERVKRLEERLGGVRNLREEAAVSAELEMVRRALQSDEQEAYTLLDQIRKLEQRLTELEEAYAEARELVEPRLQEIRERRSVAESRLEELREERQDFAASMDETELKLYEAIRQGGRSVAVAELTEDGACGNCFGIVPLQVQNEIRHGSDLIRCEGCGVILTAPGPQEAAAEPDEVEETAAAAEASSELGETAEIAEGAEPDAAGVEEGAAAAAEGPAGPGGTPEDAEGAEAGAVQVEEAAVDEPAASAEPDETAEDAQERGPPIPARTPVAGGAGDGPEEEDAGESEGE